MAGIKKINQVTCWHLFIYICCGLYYITISFFCNTGHGLCYLRISFFGNTGHVQLAKVCRRNTIYWITGMADRGRLPDQHPTVQPQRGTTCMFWSRALSHRLTWKFPANHSFPGHHCGSFWSHLGICGREWEFAKAMGVLHWRKFNCLFSEEI